MLTVNDAFRKFKSRLELNDREQKNAIARHTEVRDRSNFCDEASFAIAGNVLPRPTTQSLRIRAQASRSGRGTFTTRSQREVKALSTAWGKLLVARNNRFG